MGAQVVFPQLLGFPGCQLLVSEGNKTLEVRLTAASDWRKEMGRRPGNGLSRGRTSWSFCP